MSLPEQVQMLHTAFCQAAQRPEPLRFAERAWSDLLTSPEYTGDATRLRDDVLHLVRYLRKQIAREKRNAGCLKLRNFLAPDQFLADLAEARAQMKPLAPLPGATAVPCTPPRPALTPPQAQRLRVPRKAEVAKNKQDHGR